MRQFSVSDFRLTFVVSVDFPIVDSFVYSNGCVSFGGLHEFSVLRLFPGALILLINECSLNSRPIVFDGPLISGIFKQPFESIFIVCFHIWN